MKTVDTKAFHQSSGSETSAAAQTHLVRELGLLDATMIVVGSMIGSGIFIVSAESTRLVGAPGWLIVAWALAGVLTITGALCCAELAGMMPQAGGQYVYLRAAYGPATGFLFGWALLFVIQTGTIAAVAIAFANFAGVLTDKINATKFIVAPVIFRSYALSLSTQQLVAIVVILFLTFTNTLGLKLGKLVQNFFTVAKTLALFGLIVAGLALGWNTASAAYTSSWWNPALNNWNPANAQPGFALTGTLALVLLLGKAMTGPLFAQSAWNNISFAGGEVKSPGRNLPRALLTGCAIVVALYLLANLAYVVTLPLAGIQNAAQNRVGTAVMQKVFGTPGTILMALLIMVSTFGCNNGLILAGARVYYAMARDGLFFQRVGTLNKAHVPAVALVAQCVWASLLVLPRTVTFDPTTKAATFGNVYTQLLEYIISADLVFYALMAGAVIVMRRKAPDMARPFRTHGYPLVPMIYILLALLLIIDLAYLTPETSLAGYVLVLSGIPVYLLWQRRSRAQHNEHAKIDEAS